MRWVSAIATLLSYQFRPQLVEREGFSVPTSINRLTNKQHRDNFTIIPAFACAIIFTLFINL